MYYALGLRTVDSDFMGLGKTAVGSGPQTLKQSKKAAKKAAKAAKKTAKQQAKAAKQAAKQTTKATKQATHQAAKAAKQAAKASTVAQKQKLAAQKAQAKQAAQAAKAKARADAAAAKAKAHAEAVKAKQAAREEMMKTRQEERTVRQRQQQIFKLKKQCARRKGRWNESVNACEFPVAPPKGERPMPAPVRPVQPAPVRPISTRPPVEPIYEPEIPGTEPDYYGPIPPLPPIPPDMPVPQLPPMFQERDTMLRPWEGGTFPPYSGGVGAPFPGGPPLIDPIPDSGLFPGGELPSGYADEELAPGAAFDQGPLPASAAPGSAPVELAECTAEFDAALPLEYSDRYGPMKVLAVFCGGGTPVGEATASVAAEAAPLGAKPITEIEQSEFFEEFTSSPAMYGLGRRI